MRNQKGFSLVELMVVVAIIGVLTSIAVPAYDQMAAKARQAEAKECLAGMYTAEMGFYADQGAFTCCLAQAGYEPDGVNHYYTTGFWNSCGPWIVDYKTGQMCGTYRAWATTYTDDATYIANIYANPALKGQGIGTTYSASYTAFAVTAFGSISSSNNNFDVWSIDQSKTLINPQPGM